MDRSGEARPTENPARNSAGLLISGAAHVIAIAALLWFHTDRPRPAPNPSHLIVSVVDSPDPDPPGPESSDPESGTSGGEAEASAPQAVVPPTPLPTPEPVSSADVEVEEAPPASSDILSDSQLVGAIDAGEDGVGDASGGGGGAGGCNTARVLQTALRRDPMVLAAVTNAGRAGKSVMLWDGDWVRSGAQDGKGLSGVRQAILWQLAFAPEACREKPMQGLVLLSLAGGTRLAIGADAWRWSDLLGLPDNVGAGPRNEHGPDLR